MSMRVWAKSSAGLGKPARTLLAAMGRNTSLASMGWGVLVLYMHTVYQELIKKCSGSSYLLSLHCLSNLIKVKFELRNFQSSIAVRNYFSILNCTKLNCPLFRVISVLNSILSWFFSKNHAVIWQIYVTISVGPFSDT